MECGEGEDVGGLPPLDLPEVIEAAEEGHDHVLADLVWCSPHHAGTVEMFLDKVTAVLESNAASPLSGMNNRRASEACQWARRSWA